MAGKRSCVKCLRTQKAVHQRTRHKRWNKTDLRMSPTWRSVGTDARSVWSLQSHHATVLYYQCLCIWAGHWAPTADADLRVFPMSTLTCDLNVCVISLREIQTFSSHFTKANAAKVHGTESLLPKPAHINLWRHYQEMSSTNFHQT